MNILLALLQIVLPFLLLWVFLGFLAKLVRFAPTVLEGMNLVGRKVSDFFCEETTPPILEDFISVEPCYIAPLTSMLLELRIFTLLAFEYARYNQFYLEVVYICEGTDIRSHMDAILAVFTLFIRKVYNLSVGYPVPVYGFYAPS